MDSYTFRAHLNAVIIGMARLDEVDMLPRPTYAREVIEYLRGVELMSRRENVAVSQFLLTMGQPAWVPTRTPTGEQQDGDDG